MAFEQDIKEPYWNNVKSFLETAPDDADLVFSHPLEWNVANAIMSIDGQRGERRLNSFIEPVANA